MYAYVLLLLASGSVNGSGDSRLIPAFFTGERLYEICSGPNEHQCWMYVAGVLDGVFASETGQERTLCGGSTISNKKAAELVTDYLRDNAEVRHKAAAVAVANAMRPELACSEGG